MSTTHRGHQRKIKLIKVNAPSIPAVALAVSHPSEDQSRGYEAGARQAPAAMNTDTVDIPLPVREQTILSYYVSPAVRQILNGFGRMPTGSESAFAHRSIDVSIDHSLLGEHVTPGQAIAAHSSNNGAMELRLATCRAVQTNTTVNPVTGRQLP